MTSHPPDLFSLDLKPFMRTQLPEIHVWRQITVDACGIVITYACMGAVLHPDGISEIRNYAERFRGQGQIDELLVNLASVMADALPVDGWATLNTVTDGAAMVVTVKPTIKPKRVRK